MHMTTIATSPDDPQALVGLSKCMDALKRMDVVWPSAGRAWELLHGAKDDLRDYEPARASISRPKKRAADDQLDMAVEEDASHQHIGRPTSGLPHGFSADHAYQDPTLDITDSESPLAFFTSYDRWSSDNSLGFPSGLSTSVLPQQYSTGFADDRGVSGVHRPPSGMMDSNGRYPQYWSDYSALGQPSSMLGSMYGMSILPGQVVPGSSQQQQAAQQHQQQQQQLQSQSSVYMGDHFNIFNPLPPPQ